MLLYTAMTTPRQVMVTLQSGKVYIGLVTSSFDPSAERKYFQLLPLTSGYRQERDHALIRTTDYTRVYFQIGFGGAESPLQEHWPRFKRWLWRASDWVRTRLPWARETTRDPDELRPEDFQIVIPVAEIRSISMFDQDAYELFNPSEAEPAPDAG